MNIITASKETEQSSPVLPCVNGGMFAEEERSSWLTLQNNHVLLLWYIDRYGGV